jgi:hypothetical protein
MDCQEAQDSIVGSLVERLGDGGRMALEGHIASCDACRNFAETQGRLDARLRALAPPAGLSPGFRASLRKRIRRDPGSAWPDFLPEVAHVAGCAFAVVLAVLLVPRYAGIVIPAGAAITVVTYFLQSALRSALEGLEGDA